MSWLRAFLVLAALLVLSCEKEPQVKKTPSKVATAGGQPQAGRAGCQLACTYRFYDVTDNAEVNRLRSAIQAQAKDGRVAESSGSDPSGQFREYQFTLASLDDTAKLDSALRAKAVEAGDQAPTALLYEQFDARFAASYRTVTLTASLESVVRFKITPGASLFYSLGAGQEVAVPKDQVDSAGKVALALRIPRGQRYLYARSAVGDVQRYLRINCETGQIEEVDRAAYETWRTSGNP
jgi:hypothetical protein